MKTELISGSAVDDCDYSTGTIDKILGQHVKIKHSTLPEDVTGSLFIVEATKESSSRTMVTLLRISWVADGLVEKIENVDLRALEILGN